jgi:hypothetical protein
VPDLPQPCVDNAVLTTQDADAAEEDDLFLFLRTMDMAMHPAPDEESAVLDFVMQLFKILGYIGWKSGRFARTRKELHFLVCREIRRAKLDACIVDCTNDILLLVHEEKAQLAGGGEPHPQLIAEAIAAFDANNDKRRRIQGLKPFASKVIPGIVMTRAMPTFYKIPVTSNLARAVNSGLFPDEETIVYAHYPQLPRHYFRFAEGMKALDNRQILLSCYEAFKQFF